MSQSQFDEILGGVRRALEELDSILRIGFHDVDVYPDASGAPGDVMAEIHVEGKEYAASIEWAKACNLSYREIAAYLVGSAIGESGIYRSSQ